MHYEGKMASSDAFYFGETPANLSAAGLDALPLAMTISDFRKSTKKKHNIPRRVLKRLAENLRTPILSFGADGKVGVLLNDIDGNGKKLLAGIDGRAIMDREPVNAISSLYGIEHPAEWIRNQIAAGKKLVIYDEKRADAWLQTYGYSASVGEGIRSLDGSVQQPGEKSNPQNAEKTKKSLKSDSRGRALTAAQQEYFEDSQVLSRDGKCGGNGRGHGRGGGRSWEFCLIATKTQATIWNVYRKCRDKGN